MKLISGSVITEKALKARLGQQKAKALRDSLSVFPTPFKNVYYIPFETEKKAFYITSPYKVLIDAAKLVLGQQIYYGLETAAYFERAIWNPMPAHIMNTKRSSKLTLRPKASKYWRTKRRQDILRQFPYPVSFHRLSSVKDAKPAYKDGIPYAPSMINLKNAEYLCKRGARSACNFLATHAKPKKMKPQRK